MITEMLQNPRLPTDSIAAQVKPRPPQWNLAHRHSRGHSINAEALTLKSLDFSTPRKPTYHLTHRFALES